MKKKDKIKLLEIENEILTKALTVTKDAIEASIKAEKGEKVTIHDALNLVCNFAKAAFEIKELAKQKNEIIKALDKPVKKL